MTDHADIQAPGLKLGERPPAVPESLERMAGAAIMALLCLITFANVVVRYFTNISFVGALVGTGAAFATDRHIRLTFLVERLPVAKQRLLEIAVLACCLGLFALLAWLAALYVWDEYRFEVMSPGLGIPQWRYTVALPACALLICLRILGRMVRVARTVSA
jgi:TRAP-type transport system small permease protein